MATTFYSNSSRGYYLRLDISESNINVANNTSVVGFNLYLVLGSNYFQGRVDSSAGYIDGAWVWGANSRYDFYSGNQTYQVGYGSRTIVHNSDGSRTVPFSFSFTADSGGYGPVGLTVSGSFPLSTIPRATQPSLSPSTQVMGSSIKISLPRATSAFTHRIKYVFEGSGEAVIAESGVGTSYTWIPPKSLASRIPSKGSGTGTIYVATYNGSSLIGWKSAVFTLKANPNDKALITGITTEEANSDIKSAFNLAGKFVKGLSQIKCTVRTDTLTAYGAKVNTYETEVEGTTYGGETFTTNSINTVGSVGINAGITDSRGMKHAYSSNITVLDYAAPQISLAINPTGNQVRCTMTGKVYSVDNKNSKTLKLYWKKTSESTWQSRTLSTASWDFTANTTVYNVDPDTTYDFKAELTDKLNTSSSIATTGVVCISRLAGGKGVTFFKEATSPGFWVGDIDYTITNSEFEELKGIIGK